MKEEEIKRAIERIVESTNTDWYICISDNPDHFKNEDDKRVWSADTETIARNVKTYFIEKGMREDIDEEGHYVWISLYHTSLQKSIDDWVDEFMKPWTLDEEPTNSPKDKKTSG